MFVGMFVDFFEPFFVSGLNGFAELFLAEFGDDIVTIRGDTDVGGGDVFFAIERCGLVIVVDYAYVIIVVLVSEFEAVI